MLIDDELTFSIVTGPSHGKLAKFDSASGKLTFSPNENFAGEDSFTFRVTDQKGQHSNIAKVSIRVSGNDLSILLPMTISMPQLRTTESKVTT